MIVATARLEVTTDEGVALSDLTQDVNAFLKASGVDRGLCVVGTSGEGLCLSLSADFDEDVDDLLRLAQTHLAPVPAEPGSASGRPSDLADRSDAEGGYTPAGVLADCISVPVRDGAVATGTWEAIVLLDTRGPALRPIEITVMGE